MKKDDYFPVFEVFKEKARSGTIVPVYREAFADIYTPVSAFMKIDNGADAFLLESVEGGEKWGRYSILGTGARKVIKSKGKKIEITENNVTTALEGDPLSVLQKEASRYRAVSVAGAPRFSGGVIGCIGYDAVRHMEKLPDTAKKDLDVHDIYFLFVDTFLVFDNVEQKIKAVSNAVIEEDTDIEAVYEKAKAEIDALLNRLNCSEPTAIAEKKLKSVYNKGAQKISSNFTKEGFLSAARRIKEYIVSGDIIQTVLSQRFSTELETEPFNIYRALRVVNPSPYLFFLRLGDTIVVGSSPELLVRVEEDEVNVKPIAGTRQRGRDEDEDRALEAELLRDPKERAEHIMLVDLGRNDLGRVCRPGTVEVDDLMGIERYSHVMHIVSNVRGLLEPQKNAFDSLRACFPAGTLTGASKIRAMEIIEELEPCKRGIYGGSVGYISYSGNMDMCIAIRTMVIKDNRIYVQAGAGIVADSVPEKEFEETENKAKGVFKAIELARDI
ncbi:anthranilate synthase component I [bacterium]|nr:MAG: anthranilate synthase component I [bacterium]